MFNPLGIRFLEHPGSPESHLAPEIAKNIKFLKKELHSSSQALQENIHISHLLLKEVKRLDNLKIDLLHDKERLETKNTDLMDENHYLREKIKLLNDGSL